MARKDRERNQVKTKKQQEPFHLAKLAKLFGFFSEIFKRHEQHPETFAILLAQMLVVHLVGTAHGAGISVVRVAE